MLKLHANLAIAICAAMASSPGMPAEGFPNKPLRIIAPEAGGNGDTTARLIAAGLARALGHNVVVENRGGNAVIGAQALATSQPDGYTMLVGSTLWMLPLIQKNVPFDPARDFAPITLATRTPMILVVNPSLPVNSVKELVALAKAKPGELSYGSAGVGSTNHLAPELFKLMAQVSILHVPYKGVALALNDLISGRLQVMFPAASSAMPHVKAGRLRALAVSTTNPSQLAPGLPTVAAAGLPGFEAAFLSAVLTRAGTPPPIINRLSHEIVRVVTEQEVKDKLFLMGMDAVGSTPAQLGQTMQLEVAKWGKVIRDAGIHTR
ncbi:MAG: tripartite tricarboxylate transporter substrate binding protein [Burkholderiales bacterium]|nr:tripartite tricarboxylate transporter substrate binding protein [Burkholderiales bacterium]